MENEALEQPGASEPSAQYLKTMALRRESLRAELASLLPPKARFVWEVGCGHGHFLTAYAAAHPDALCVGVDINIERVRLGLRKRNRAELGHLHFVRTEARLFLEVLPPDARFSAIYVLFPDPWPKKRHHKNRLLKADFLKEVAERCTPGTPLYFRTDHDPYFEEVVETVKAHPDWAYQENGHWPFELETIFQKRAAAHQSLIAFRT